MTQKRQPLSPGDRMPDFNLPDAHGTTRQFYGETDGRPILLLALAGDPAEALSALSREQADLKDLQVMVVAKRAPQGLEGIVGFQESGSGLLSFLKEAAPGGARAILFVMDTNQRVLGALSGRPVAELLGEARALLAEASETRTASTILRLGAPVLVLPRVFPLELCERLISSWRQEHHEGGVYDAKTNRRDESKKKTLEHVIEDPALNQEIGRIIGRRVGQELRRAFMFAEPMALESFIVMRYGPERQDFFGMHRDRYTPEHPRRFAVSLNLNDDFEGGELSFPEYGPHLLYKPPAGAAAVFSCSLLHEALPVRAGERFVMTAFFNVASRRST